MNNFRYEILTQRMPDSEIIAQQVNTIREDDLHQEVRETILCQMINLADESIKRELVKMGWRPPNTASAWPVMQAAIAVCEARREAGAINHKLHNAIAELTNAIKE